MGQVTSEAVTHEHIDSSLINAATGPIYVRGAEPGDALSVTLLEIRRDALGAAMCVLERGRLGRRVTSATRLCHVEDGLMTMNERVTFPARPMFGVIGVAPESGAISTLAAGRHGGNMDDNSNCAGATVHLAVLHPGGLLGIGDVHASMGDGEISGTGIEIGGTALIRVELVKGVASARPITESQHSIVTHATAGGDNRRGDAHRV